MMAGAQALAASVWDAAGPTQYTEADALTAIMLTVSVLREVQHADLRAELHI